MENPPPLVADIGFPPGAHARGTQRPESLRKPSQKARFAPAGRRGRTHAVLPESSDPIRERRVARGLVRERSGLSECAPSHQLLGDDLTGGVELDEAQLAPERLVDVEKTPSGAH